MPRGFWCIPLKAPIRCSIKTLSKFQVGIGKFSFFLLLLMLNHKTLEWLNEINCFPFLRFGLRLEIETQMYWSSLQRNERLIVFRSLSDRNNCFHSYLLLLLNIASPFRKLSQLMWEDVIGDVQVTSAEWICLKQYRQLYWMFYLNTKFRETGNERNWNVQFILS